MYTPFKMKGKSPMMKALIGKQGNLPVELQAKIEASPVPMKKESAMKMKKESSMKMKKESSMKMMKKSPAKVSPEMQAKFDKRDADIAAKKLAKKNKAANAPSASERRAQYRKEKADGTYTTQEQMLKNLKNSKSTNKKENEKKLLKDYNNPKRKDPLANLTGPKKPKVKKETVNLVEKNPEVKTVKKDTIKKVTTKKVVKADPLTKNIMNTNQKGDGDLKATVKNKPKTTVNGKETKSKVVNKNKKGKVNVFSAKYKSMTRSQRAKFYGADYKTRK